MTDQETIDELVRQNQHATSGELEELYVAGFSTPSLRDAARLRFRSLVRWPPGEERPTRFVVPPLAPTDDEGDDEELVDKPDDLSVAEQIDLPVVFDRHHEDEGEL